MHKFISPPLHIIYILATWIIQKVHLILLLLALFLTLILFALLLILFVGGGGNASGFGAGRISPLSQQYHIFPYLSCNPAIALRLPTHIIWCLARVIATFSLLMSLVKSIYAQMIMHKRGSTPGMHQL